MSTQTSLSEFTFYTSQSWAPNYSSLLAFKRMTKLEIQFSCFTDCSSTVDYDVIIDLAQAMPELEILQLDKQPHQAVRGVIFKGLIALTLRYPLGLSKLHVYFQANRSAEAISTTEPSSPSKPAVVTPQMNCALTDLQVGETPISESSALVVGLILL